MNCGNRAIAWSGVAASSKTARAAAQHRSSVSVNSMAAVRIDSGMPLRTVIAVSNGFSDFMVSSSPCGGIAGIEKLALSTCGGLTFSTRRQSGRRACVRSQLPVSCAVRGQAHGFGCAGAVGAFSLMHGRSVCAAVLPVYHYNRSPQP